MRKLYNIIVTLFILGIAVIYIMLYAEPFKAMVLGILHDPSHAGMYLKQDIRVWAGFLAGLTSLVIFIVRVALTIWEREDERETQPTDLGFSGRLGWFLERQRVHVVEWRNKSRILRNLKAYGIVLKATLLVMFATIWLDFLWEELINISMPLGLICGELTAVVLWAVWRHRTRPNIVLTKLGRSLQEELGEENAWDDFAREMLEASGKWSFYERSIQGINWGIIGSRYWVCIAHDGDVVVVDSQKVEDITVAVEAYSKWWGLSEDETLLYVVRFFYKKDQFKKDWDKSFRLCRLQSRRAIEKMLLDRTGGRYIIEE